MSYDLISHLSDLASHLTASTTAATQQEHVSKLGRAFRFSRWFIVTYQSALLAVVLLVIACRWYLHTTRSRRRGQRLRELKQRNSGNETNGAQSKRQAKASIVVSENGVSSSSSSSSSDSSDGVDNCGTAPSQSLHYPDERTRLLAASYGPSGFRRRLPMVWRYFRSILLYQPAPVPVLRKVLPPNITTLWILSLFALNLFYLFFNTSFGTPEFYSILADRASLLFVANLPWLYILSAKNQPLKRLTGDSYENLNLLHRRLGEWMCFLAALHLVGMLKAWYDLLRPAGFGLLTFLTLKYILWGWVSWLCYETLYVLSLGSFREWWYEVFLGSHVVLQAGALAFLFLHHYRSRPYVLISLGIFALDRLVWRMMVKRYKTTVDLKVMEDDETILVSADWLVPTKEELGITQRVLGRNLRHGWSPSEHMFISLPGISRKYYWQAHPMTIASAAPSHEQRYAWFNLIVRAKGGFSRDLLDYARDHSTAQAVLDGPYGSLHALEMLQSSDLAFIVAGGSGIAVAYPMLWSLLHAAPGIDSERQTPRQQVCLIWIVQESSHISWIGQERLDELRELGLRVIIPTPSRKGGRPNVGVLLAEQVEQFGEDDHDAVGVVVSGPDSLNRAVQNTCAGMVRRGKAVEVAVEKFGW